MPLLQRAYMGFSPIDDLYDFRNSLCSSERQTCPESADTLSFRETSAELLLQIVKYLEGMNH